MAPKSEPKQEIAQGDRHGGGPAGGGASDLLVGAAIFENLYQPSTVPSGENAGKTLVEHGGRSASLVYQKCSSILAPSDLSFPESFPPTPGPSRCGVRRVRPGLGSRGMSTRPTPFWHRGGRFCQALTGWHPASGAAR